jgi:hypothetical protein
MQEAIKRSGDIIWYASRFLPAFSSSIPASAKRQTSAAHNNRLDKGQKRPGDYSTVKYFKSPPALNAESNLDFSFPLCSTPPK